MKPDDVARLACPSCRGTLSSAGAHLRCRSCSSTWPVRDGIPSFVDEAALGGLEWALRGIYDWLAPLHDPAVDMLLPLLQGSAAAEARERYIRRLELDRLPVETSGRNASILEVGVGAGGNLPLLEWHIPREANVELWGLDYSLGMLAQCRRRLARGRRRSMRLLHADSHALPFPDSSFDRVFHVGGIASYRDPTRALAEMARVARSGTPIVVVDEQLDPAIAHGLLRRLAFRAITFYDSAPHAPREHLPRTVVDVVEEQVSSFYYCLTFRTAAGTVKRETRLS